MPASNIDTDVILPKQFLKRVDRAGLRDAVFHDLRFDSDGSVRDDFILNSPAYAGARFLVTGANFGCGSSREHAVWGLIQYGIRAIVAESFAGIFFDNSANNGLLLIALPRERVAAISSNLMGRPGAEMVIDLNQQNILGPCFDDHFDIEPARKARLLDGLDAIDATLKYEAEITAFELSHIRASSWSSSINRR